MSVEEVKEPITIIKDLATLSAFLSQHENNKNIFYASPIPKVCKDYPCILGIDEAGRGPVLGPMVYGTAFCPLNEATIPDSLGCADSKVLNEQTRDSIFEKMCANYKLGWAVEVISPTTISNAMLSRHKYSLNKISMDAAVKLIRSAAELGVNIKYIYVDTVGPPEKYEAYLKNLFPKYEIKVSKKADSLFPIVSAASICAKVTRDHALKVWQFEDNIEIDKFGSGYPNDPVTKQFMIAHRDMVFGFPQIVRFGWSTAQEALKEAYHVEWEECEEEPTVVKNQSITSFFKVANSDKEKQKTEHEFFTSRNLSRQVEF